MVAPVSFFFLRAFFFFLQKEGRKTRKSIGLIFAQIPRLNQTSIYTSNTPINRIPKY